MLWEKKILRTAYSTKALVVCVCVHAHVCVSVFVLYLEESKRAFVALILSFCREQHQNSAQILMKGIIQ